MWSPVIAEHARIWIKICHIYLFPINFNPALQANSSTMGNQPLAAPSIYENSIKQDGSINVENNKHAVPWI